MASQCTATKRADAYALFMMPARYAMHSNHEICANSLANGRSTRRPLERSAGDLIGRKYKRPTGAHTYALTHTQLGRLDNINHTSRRTKWMSRRQPVEGGKLSLSVDTNHSRPMFCRQIMCTACGKTGKSAIACFIATDIRLFAYNLFFILYDLLVFDVLV